ncbi:hypothetical protein U1Q18_000900, partial [Sarracenia purpurea var. burkii]
LSQMIRSDSKLFTAVRGDCETSGVNWHGNRIAKDEWRRLAAMNDVNWRLLRDGIDLEGCSIQIRG